MAQVKAVNRTRAEAQGPEGDLIQIQRGLVKGRRPWPDISSSSLDIAEIPLGLRPQDIKLKYLSASP